MIQDILLVGRTREGTQIIPCEDFHSFPFSCLILCHDLTHAQGLFYLRLFFVIFHVHLRNELHFSAVYRSVNSIGSRAQ